MYPSLDLKGLRGGGGLFGGVPSSPLLSLRPSSWRGFHRVQLSSEAVWDLITAFCLALFLELVIGGEVWKIFCSFLFPVRFLASEFCFLASSCFLAAGLRVTVPKS